MPNANAHTPEQIPDQAPEQIPDQTADAPPLIQPYKDPEHEPFFFNSLPRTESRGAALLIHGFPGTPAEMRPLGQALHAAGWQARGLLLPGFGKQIAHLADQRAEDWVAAAVTELRALRREHERVALIGYSMGGAVAINAAAQEAPDRLALIAPFWTLTTGWQDWIWPVARRIFRTLRPFKDADFSDPKARQELRNFMPDADLDDPAVQQAIRGITLPSSVLNELRRVGRMAYRHIREVPTPGLVIQGSRDEVVPPTRTRKLLAQARPDRFTLAEIDGGHSLIQAQRPTLPEVAERVQTYLDG